MNANFIHAIQPYGGDRTYLVEVPSDCTIGELSTLYDKFLCHCCIEEAQGKEARNQLQPHWSKWSVPCMKVFLSRYSTRMLMQQDRSSKWHMEQMNIDIRSDDRYLLLSESFVCSRVGTLALISGNSTFIGRH